MFWSDQETKSKPLAEKIRQHFLNHNVHSYRSPPIDLDSSSDTSFDLSNSFEQAIRSQRAMNKPLSTSLSDRPESECHNASAMCRMLNGLELVGGNTFSEENVSPFKLVGLTRPSTIVEESMSTSRSFCTAFAPTQAATSFATACSDKDSTGSFNFTRDSLQKTSLAAAVDQCFDDDSLNRGSADSSESVPTAGVDPTSNDFAQDDTLEDVEYDHNGSRYILRPTRKLGRFSSTSISVDSSPDEVILIHDDDSDGPAESSYQTARTHAKTDASEDDISVGKIDFQAAEGAEDLFKRNPNLSFYNDDSDEHLSVSMNTDGNRSHLRVDRSNVISLVDSDSESDSSHTNLHGLHAAVENDSNIADVQCPTFIDYSTYNSTKYEQHPILSRDLPSNVVSVVLADSSSDEQNENEEEEEEGGKRDGAVSISSDPVSKPARESDTDSIESAMLMPDRFNDTIERMDFMIEHGRRIAAIQKSAKKTASPSPLAQTPKEQKLSVLKARCLQSVSTSKSSPKQPLFGTPLASDSPILKEKSTNSPATSSSKPTFKKPMPIKTNLTPGLQRKHTPNSASRIPKPISATKLTNFDHVRSPIGAYISKTAPNPVRQNLNPTREFLDSTYCAGASKGLDYTLPVFVGAPPHSPKSRYPQTIYIQAKCDKITDKDTNHLPGDQNVQKLIGSQPMVVINRGMINTYPPPLYDDDGTHSEFAGQSFASFQLIIGDVNVLEVYNGCA